MKSRALLVIVALLLLGCLVLLGVGLLLIRARIARAAEQPLVLINAPASGADVWMDRATPVLVTARSRSGVARVELWANGRLLENRAVPQQGLSTFSTAFVFPFTLISVPQQPRQSRDDVPAWLRPTSCSRLRLPSMTTLPRPCPARAAREPAATEVG